MTRRFPIIDSKVDGMPRRSHYLAGVPPIPIDRYLAWIAGLG